MYGFPFVGLQENRLIHCQSRYNLARHAVGTYKGASYVLLSCTAPIPGTVDDFWQMMWDQNIIMVVQLTKNVEGTLRKVCVYGMGVCGWVVALGHVCAIRQN